MILFEGKVGCFMALTRPLGEVYFANPEASPYAGRPSINLAQSPDPIHWKPLDQPDLRAQKGSTSSMKVGGRSQAIRTDRGWFLIYHGFETREAVGVYRTFWALPDLDDPSRILRVEGEQPVLEANPELTRTIAHQKYLPTPVVFTTGVADAGDYCIVASGEADLAYRIANMPNAMFA